MQKHLNDTQGISYFKEGARHGFRFLKDVMWDKEYGGFFILTDQKGNVKSNGEVSKEAYGNAFGIYALGGILSNRPGDTAALNPGIKSLCSGWKKIAMTLYIKAIFNTCTGMALP